MNALTKNEGPVSAEAMHALVGAGDLSKLTPAQKVQFYMKVCDSLGLNPFTRPFRILTFQGQTVLYATRDCGDQLRNLRKINIEIVDKKVEDDLFIVTARARTPDGRIDEDMGAVTIGALRGEARANAILKAITKAKRRVTLSICGLGFIDETEADTLHGAVTSDVNLEAELGDGIPDRVMNAPPAASEAPPAPKSKQTAREWLDQTEAALRACQTAEDVDAIVFGFEVQKALTALRNGALERLNDMIEAAQARTREEPAAT